MKKKILIMLCIFSLIAAAFAGCSQKDVEADAISSTESTTQTTMTTPATKPAEITTKPTEPTTVKKDSTASTKASENKTTVNTTKSSTTTTKAATKPTANQTTKKVVKTTAKQTTKSTTKKQTTTKKVTTTKKKTTTKKNVTAKEVQNQVNSYIRSRGITVDSSLRPNNAGWSGQISKTQDALNNGRTLQLCKEYVEIEISNGYSGMSLYCYYDDTSFYILYL